VKANSSLAVLACCQGRGGLRHRLGRGVVPCAEGGGDARTVVFSGVGKTAEEVEYALAQGIHGFNCESEAELVWWMRWRRHGVKVRRRCG